MSTLCDVTIVLDTTPTRALHDALTAPVTDRDDQALSLVDTSRAGGHKVYTGAVYAACFNHVSETEVSEFLQGLPAAAFGVTSGVAMVDHESSESRVPVVGRIGWLPPQTPA